MKDLTFIQNFTKIKVSKACKELGYDQSNLMKGKCGRDAEKKVRIAIEISLLSLLYNVLKEEIEWVEK